MFLLILLIIIIFITLYFIYSNMYKYDNIVKVKSPIDNDYYWVKDRYDKINAANTLAKIKINMTKLINHLKINMDKFPNNTTYIQNLIKRTKIINIKETPDDDKFTSYTISKGAAIYFCLRSKIIDEIHDMNTLMYVTIHELAHVGNDEIGHTPLFKAVFKFFLEQSVEIDIYTPIDYRIMPQHYCGMTINEFLL